MTTEEAARILDPETSASALEEYGDKFDQFAAGFEALQIAVKALRKPFRIDQEAWGCPYCTPDAEGYVRKFGAFSLHNGMLGTGHCKAVEIKYCPECARPLNGAAASELKERLRG